MSEAQSETEESEAFAQFEPAQAERDTIIGDMYRWLGADPLLSCRQIWERWGADFEMCRSRWRREAEQGSLPRFKTHHDDLKRSVRMYTLRNAWIKQFGFAIPCAELFGALQTHQPVVEIGAGSGYLTALARRNGIDIIGTDSMGGRYGFEHGHHDEKQIKMAGKTAVRRFRDRTVFCSWPSLGKTWFRQACRAMRIGQRLIVIREECCAEESAWDYLDQCFIAEGIIEIPAWPLINDYAAVYRKRRQRPAVDL